MTPKVLRDYQLEAVECLSNSLKSGDSPLGLLATGTGKTLIAAELIRRRCQAGGTAIMVAHRQELVEQNARAIAEHTGLQVGIEMADQTASAQDSVISASVQTLHEDRVAKLAGDRLLIVDECHHQSHSNESYERIANAFTGGMVGLSATLDRLDSVGLLGFTGIEYSYGIEEGIADGWLVPIQAKQIKLRGLDLTKIKRVAGDYHQGQLEEALKSSIYESARGLLDHYEGRLTLAFCRNVWHAETIVETLNKIEDWEVAKLITGETPKDERRQILADFQTGAFDILVNVGVLTEGTDLPPVSCVAMLRPTMSRALYTQCVGRGTRPCNSHGKKDLLLLDFVGSTRDHRLIGPAEALLGAEDEDLLSDFQDIVDESQGIDIQEAMEEALRRSRESEGAFRLAALRPAVWSDSKIVDPFRSIRKLLVNLSDLAPESIGEPPAPRSTDADATLTQVQTLERHKLWPDLGKGELALTRRESSWLISAVVQRSEEGLCTLRQASVLRKNKLRTDLTFAEAGYVMGAMAANRWRVPHPIWKKYRYRDQVGGRE